MKTETKKLTGLLEALMVASVFVTMVAMGSAQAGIERQEEINFFMFLSYITLGLSLLLLVFAFVHLMVRRRKGIKKRRIEELIETIKEVRELKKKIGERGENLTSLSDVFLTQVSILSEINNTRTLILFGLEILVAF